MSRTIKEVAEYFGVSKTTIRNKMTDDFRKKWVHTSTAKGGQTLVITEDGINALKSMFGGGNFTENQFVPNDNFLAELKAKNEQIEKLQKLLDQSQQLLLSEQKNNQLLLETQSEKTDDWEEKYNQLEDNRQKIINKWQKEKALLEKQVSDCQNSLSEANRIASNNYAYAESLERWLWITGIIAVIFFVIMLVLICIRFL